MKHYIRIYWTLMRLNFSALVAYRGNFINNMLSSVIWAIFSLLTIYLLTLNVTSMFGWKKEEILLLSGMYGIVIGIFHTLYSRNFSRFSRIIHLGELDVLLLKPVDTQFLMSYWIVNYTALLRVVVGITFVAYLVTTYHMHITAIAVLTSIVGIFIATLLLYAIWYIVMTSSIWFSNLYNLVDVLFQVTNISRFPQDMFRELSAYLFWFLLPLTFVITTPAKVLLLRASTGDVIGLVGFATLLFIASRKFWKFALRFYASASS